MSTPRSRSGGPRRSIRLLSATLVTVLAVGLTGLPASGRSDEGRVLDHSLLRLHAAGGDDGVTRVPTLPMGDDARARLLAGRVLRARLTVGDATLEAGVATSFRTQGSRARRGLRVLRISVRRRVGRPQPEADRHPLALLPPARHLRRDVGGQGPDGSQGHLEAHRAGPGPALPCRPATRSSPRSTSSASGPNRPWPRTRSASRPTSRPVRATAQAHRPRSTCGARRWRCRTRGTSTPVWPGRPRTGWSAGTTARSTASRCRSHRCTSTPRPISVSTRPASRRGPTPRTPWRCSGRRASTPPRTTGPAGRRRGTPGRTRAQTANAANYRISGWDTIFRHAGSLGGDTVGTTPTEIEALKGRLAAGQPVAIAFRVRQDFNTYRSGWYAGTGALTNGLHEMLALGYDANGLFIQNSWGTDRGVGGYVYMTWDAVRRDLYEATFAHGLVAASSGGGDSVKPHHHLLRQAVRGQLRGQRRPGADDLLLGRHGQRRGEQVRPLLPRRRR